MDHLPPIEFSPEMEQVEKNESETIRKLGETALSISNKTYADSKPPCHAMRSVHVKSHGIVKGELRVLDSLPAELAQGIFQPGKVYDVVLRFSSPPGDIMPDKVSTPRAVAVKLIGVEGERLSGSEGQVTQNFTMVNGPAFQTSNAKKFLANLKLLGATTDKCEKCKIILSAVLRKMDSFFELLGIKLTILRALGGHPPTHPLGETFFTEVPFLYGKYVAKGSMAPVSPALKALQNKKLDLNESGNILRNNVFEYFASNGGEWEFRIQLCRDLDKMPIENAKKVWPQEISPYIAVARLTVPPQQSWIDGISQKIEDGLTFSPWQGVAAHRPLGSIMRARKQVYEMSAKFRTEKNGIAVREPKSIDEIVITSQT